MTKHYCDRCEKHINLKTENRASIHYYRDRKNTDMMDVSVSDFILYEECFKALFNFYYS